MSQSDFQYRRVERFRCNRDGPVVKRKLAGALAAPLVVLAAASQSPASAQGLPPVPQEMATLAWLEGEWTGSARMEYSPGQLGEFEGSERVEWRMGGRVLVVEARFTAWMGPEAGDVPVHEALGVISYDAQNERFLFRTYTARGGNGEAHVAEVTEGKVVWGYDDPRMGRVRYTISRTDDGTWHEVGHASRDGGESWHEFFEMRLRRAGG